ncbi:MAG: C1 family peptidase [Candidatus Eisenbacteria bacterium]
MRSAIPGRAAPLKTFLTWLIFASAVFGPAGAEAPDGEIPPLGLVPLPETAARMLQQAPAGDTFGSFPASMDWRDAGVVTRAKMQRTCGACWAFAAIACMESMCILAGAAPSIDLSEQFPISCDVEYRAAYGARNDGCCGGTVTVFEFLKENSAIDEGVFPFGNGDFGDTGSRGCEPSWTTIPCPEPYPTSNGWRIDGWALIAPQPVPGVIPLKAALVQGPVWIGFRVYEDFIDYWYYNDDPDTPYAHTSGDYLGCHAVLLIGYDDARDCWIARNSWGLTGPFDDGTFLVDYDADCDFGLNASRATVARDPTPVRHASLGSLRALFR